MHRSPAPPPNFEITPHRPPAGVTIHGGERAVGALGLPPAPSPRHEYSSMDVTLELVPSLDAAVDHIHHFGSGHTESIITGGWWARWGGMLGGFHASI